MAALSTLPLSQNLVAKTLNARNPFPKVYDISGGYNTFTYFTDMLNKQGSKQVDAEKYEKSKRGSLQVISRVSSSALSGTNLVVSFMDSTYANFRVNDVVMDSERVQGLVISSTPGSITLAPLYGVAWDVAKHFKENMYAKVITDASPNRYSTGKPSLYNTPDLDYNYSSITRDSNQLARRDKIGTYVQYQGEGWWSNQEIEMIERIAKGVENKFIFQERDQRVVNGNQTNFNGGLIWSIKNRGGIHYPSTSALTQTIFHELIRQISVKNTNPNKKVTLFGGNSAILAIQSFTSDYIKYAGTANTFAVGSGMGLNVMKYVILGVEVDIVRLPLFDDPYMFPEASSIPGVTGSRMSNAFFLIDAAPVSIVGGGFAPAIERFHFDKEFYYGYIKGMADAGTSSSSYLSASEVIIASDVDGFACHGMVDNGIDIIDAQNMLFFELIS